MRRKIEEDEGPSKSNKSEEDEGPSVRSKRKRLGESEEDEGPSVRSKRKRLGEGEKGKVSLHGEKDKVSLQSEKDKVSLQSEKDKVSPKSGKVVLDEVEGGLRVQLQRMFAERNVIVAGETHGDPQTAEIEAKLLPALKVGVSYEGDTIKAPGVNVTPDPPAYRLLYYLEDFYELLHTRMLNHGKLASRQLYDGQMDVIYNRYVKEFGNYSQPAIERSLYYEGEALAITYDRLDKFKNILFDTLNLFDNSPDDPLVYRNKLIRDNGRDLDKLFDTLKKKSGNSPTEPVMRKLRSTMMYQALKKDLADGVGKRVYKVGNNHVADIRAQFGNPSWVIDEAQYKRMLLPLNAKNNKGLTAF